jgi:chloramphenicol 3-O-phosphotransferase
MNSLPKWYVIVHETVSYSVTVEAKDQEGAKREAEQAIKKPHVKRWAKRTLNIPFVSRFRE